jgi:hypothetical protein
MDIVLTLVGDLPVGYELHAVVKLDRARSIKDLLTAYGSISGSGEMGRSPDTNKNKLN